MTDARRAVLNAIICGRPLDTTGLPPAEASWHVIWLVHDGLVHIHPDGTLTPTRLSRSAA